MGGCHVTDMVAFIVKVQVPAFFSVLYYSCILVNLHNLKVAL